jgi:tetratricopeptide (TPR) repeat protein
MTVAAKILLRFSAAFVGLSLLPLFATPKNHCGTAVCLNSLGGLYMQEGKYAEAEPLFKRALAIDEKAIDENTLDANAPNLAKVLEDYAAMLHKTKQDAAADKLEARAKTIRAAQK